eukprot:scaffold298166_cov15-Tisochrysis_lutea.AAC.1
MLNTNFSNTHTWRRSYRPGEPRPAATPHAAAMQAHVGWDGGGGASWPRCHGAAPRTWHEK